VATSRFAKGFNVSAFTLRATVLVSSLPMTVALAFLWFPFDWLSTIWPAFGVPFRIIFHDEQNHFIGHLTLFFVFGFFVYARLTILQRKPILYFFGLIVAALIQESIQAVFRHELPRFDDFNAFKGDATGGIAAFWLCLGFKRLRRRKALQEFHPTE